LAAVGGIVGVADDVDAFFDEAIDALAVGLNDFDGVEIVGSFNHAHAFVGVRDFHLDLVGILEERG